MLHCSENAGYAIASLIDVFSKSAILAGFKGKNIFWSFQSTTSKNNSHIIECDYYKTDTHQKLNSLLLDYNISTVLAFDLGFPCPVIAVLKRSGVKYIVSYWGASMSSICSPFKLKIKQMEYYLTTNKPDLFVFESEAMRKTATHGRGINAKATRVIRLGVDTNKFFPRYNEERYTYQTFNIPINRKIVFYSGHMEERKGVRVIINAAIKLIDELNYFDIHFVICGNKNNEADVYQQLLDNKKARGHVTFAGYRSDIPDLMRGSHIGVIASTGWDSFTMSSVEMMSSGLPLIVSRLQGLSETIANQKNGFLITPGDSTELAQKIKLLSTDKNLATEFSSNSRTRATDLFSIENQITLISNLLKNFIKQ